MTHRMPFFRVAPCREQVLRGTTTFGDAQERSTLQQVLLVCGILSSLLYATMLVFVPMGWESYSSVSQTVSELSAIGTPTRSLWVALGVIWTLLYAAMGWGVWRSAGPNQALQIVGGVIIISGTLGLFWPPMHQREVLAAGSASRQRRLPV